MLRLNRFRGEFLALCVAAVLNSGAHAEDSIQPLVQPPVSAAAATALAATPESTGPAAATPAANWLEVPPTACAPGACTPNCTAPGGGTGDSCGVGGPGWCHDEIGSDRLFGLFAPSDTCFSNWVSPISNPLFFEDPRTLTEVRLIYAHQTINSSNPVFQGGQANYVAAQIRAALTERLSIVANKDGYLWIDGNNDSLVPDQNGWADVTAGLKYNLIRDPEQQLLLSAGAIFEMDVGSHKVFQGRGDGEFHLFTSGGMAVTDRMHILSGTGFRLPTDTDARSQMWYWSNHIDYEVVETWYAVAELNWFHWMQSGEALGVDFEGGDLMNLGATDVAGNDIVTMAFGGKKRFGKMNEIGVGYEIPLTERKDLLQSRLYADLIIRY